MVDPPAGFDYVSEATEGNPKVSVSKKHMFSFEVEDFTGANQSEKWHSKKSKVCDLQGVVERKQGRELMYFDPQNGVRLFVRSAVGFEAKMSEEGEVIGYVIELAPEQEGRAGRVNLAKAEALVECFEYVKL